MSEERGFSNAERAYQMERLVLALPLKFCDPVLIGRPPGLAGELGTSVFSASVTYVELNGRKIAVTSAHVIRKFEEEREKDGVSIFQVNGFNLGDVQRRVIDIDDPSDLSTIDLDDIDLGPRNVDCEELRTRQFHLPASWPPARVSEGDVVAYGGWPAALRNDSADRWNIESTPYTMIGLTVRQSAADQFTVQLDRKHVKLAFGRSNEDDRDYDFGGMSGGPVLRRANLSYELIGIIKEYQPPPYDLFAFAAVDTIKGSGKLWHNTRR